MEHKEYFNALKQGSIERVYCFSGPEELIKRRGLEQLRALLLPPGLEVLNDATLENCSAQVIIDACETLPVMCDRRIVTVKDWGPLLSGKVKDEADDSKRMLEWLQNPPESCVLVFYLSMNPDGRKKLPSELRKLPGWVNFDHLNNADLQIWCRQQLKKQGKQITRRAVDMLNDMAGPDLIQLSKELEKLAAYTGEDEQIDVGAVQAVVTPSPEYNVFRILDNLLTGRLSKATELVNAELSNDNNPVRLIALLSNQLRLDTHVKSAMEKGKQTEVAKLLGITPARCGAIARQIRDIPVAELRERYLCCVEADYAIKSGRLRDRAALDLLMLKLVRNRR